MFSNKNSAPLLITAVVLLLLFAIYYYLVIPKKDQVASIQSSISSLEQNITELQSSIATLESPEGAAKNNTFAYEKKLPLQKAMNELLLNIEEIELLSTTKVSGMQFNNYDALVSESTLEVLEEETTEDAEAEPTDEAETEAAETEETLPTSTIAKESLPQELQMVTFTVNVEAMDEESLTIFLKELETLERIVRIDGVDLQVPGEENQFAEEAGVINASIQATTFYYKGEQ